jgi:hypothetical protein
VPLAAAIVATLRRHRLATGRPEEVRDPVFCVYGHALPGATRTAADLLARCI